MESIQRELRAFKRQRQRDAKDVVASAVPNPKGDKALEGLVSNLLYPSTAFDIPRPVPSVCAKKFCPGQLTIETNALSVEFAMRPDPFNFLQVTTKSPDPTLSGSYLNQAYADLVSSDHNLVGNEVLTYQQHLVLSSGTNRVVTSRSETLLINGGEGILSGGIFVHASSSYLNSGQSAAYNKWLVDTSQVAVLDFNLINNGPSTGTLQYGFATVTNEVMIPLTGIFQGTAQAYGFGVNHYTLEIAEGLTSPDITNVVFFVKLVSVGYGGHIRDLTIQPLALEWKAADGGALATTNYTIGQAVYGNSSAQASKLDELFISSRLWAPVAAQMTCNVAQQLKDYGGEFQASYLPSYIDPLLPADPDNAWETISGFKKSYPVCTNKFAQGAQATWMPMRIEDWQFRKPFVDQFWINTAHQATPSVRIIAQPAPSSGTPPSARYYLTFAACFAIQTLDPNVDTSLTKSSVLLMPLLLSLVYCHEHLVGENPDHISRLKAMMKSILNNPEVQALAKLGVTKGLPLLLSALA